MRCLEGEGSEVGSQGGPWPSSGTLPICRSEHSPEGSAWPPKDGTQPPKACQPPREEAGVLSWRQTHPALPEVSVSPPKTLHSGRPGPLESLILKKISRQQGWAGEAAPAS